MNAQVILISNPELCLIYVLWFILPFCYTKAVEQMGLWWARCFVCKKHFCGYAWCQVLSLV